MVPGRQEGHRVEKNRRATRSSWRGNTRNTTCPSDPVRKSSLPAFMEKETIPEEGDVLSVEFLFSVR